MHRVSDSTGINRDRLAALRLARGWSQSRLGRESGIDQGTISRIESGESKSPSAATVARLAAALGATVDDLASALPPSMTKRPTADEIERQLTADTRLRADAIWVPLVDNPASAGAGSPGDLGYLPVYPAYSERGDEWIAVPVQGTCLEPRLMHGHVAFVNRNAEPKAGDIVLIVHDGEAHFKIYEPRDGYYAMLSTLDGSDPLRSNETTRVLGVVREARYRP